MVKEEPTFFIITGDWSLLTPPFLFFKMADIDLTTISIPVWMWKRLRNYQTEWRNPTMWNALSRIMLEWEEKVAHNRSKSKLNTLEEEHDS